MSRKRDEPIHPPIGRLEKEDPVSEAITGIDKLVAEGIVATATNVKEYLASNAVKGADEYKEGAQDHRLISAACTAYLYGTMYVLVELYRDLGHDDKAAVEKSIEYMNAACAMVGQHIAPETEH